MTRITRRLVQFTLAIAAGAGCLIVNDKVSLTEPHAIVSTADARIGRPRTPMSYAGVARRTTRRAVGVGVAAGAIYGAPRVVAPTCVQAVDAYGRVYTRC